MATGNLRRGDRDGQTDYNMGRLGGRGSVWPLRRLLKWKTGSDAKLP